MQLFDTTESKRYLAVRQPALAHAALMRIATSQPQAAHSPSVVDIADTGRVLAAKKDPLPFRHRIRDVMRRASRRHSWRLD